jgi:hypothetical protein
MVFCQKVQGEDELCWSARVTNISRGGLKACFFGLGDTYSFLHFPPCGRDFAIIQYAAILKPSWRLVFAGFHQIEKDAV